MGNIDNVHKYHCCLYCNKKNIIVVFIATFVVAEIMWYNSTTSIYLVLLIIPRIRDSPSKKYIKKLVLN